MGNGQKAFLRLYSDRLQNPVKHIQIQPADQTRFFQYRDKDRGRQNALFRIIPSCQCLNIAHPLIDSADDRLEINLYPLLADGSIKIFDDVLLQISFFPESRIVIAIRRRI